MLKTYETIYVAKNNTEEAELEAINQKIKDFSNKSGGELGFYENWGTRDLAYNLGKEDKGKYNYLNYTADTSVIKDIDFFLKINESVLTSLTVKVFDTANLENVRKPSFKSIKTKSE